MKKTIGFCLVLWGALALAGVCPAAEVKIALDSPPDLEKSGTYVWAKSFGDHLKANGMAVKEFPRDALGAEEEMNYRAIPSAVYTHPEVGSTGMTEAQAKERGYEVKTAGNAAEALEAVVHGDAQSGPLVGRKIEDIDLPKGTTIGAIASPNV